MSDGNKTIQKNTAGEELKSWQKRGEDFNFIQDDRGENSLSTDRKEVKECGYQGRGRRKSKYKGGNMPEMLKNQQGGQSSSLT